MELFKVTRVFDDEDGESQFKDHFYPLHDGGPIGYLSSIVKVKSLMFRKVLPTYDDLHRAPAKQFVVLLDGAVEIETSRGEKRVFEPGEVLQMEDVTGKGHRSRNIKAAVRSSLFITFED